MKKILFIVILCLSYISCANKSTPQVSAGQRNFNNLKRSEVVDPDGHQLIMYESGYQGTRNYAFSIEHSPKCKKCYELFD